MISYLISYYLTAWSRVLLEKLIGLQLVKKFIPFYGTRMFITVLTIVCHLSLSWANWIQSLPPHPTYWRFIFIQGRIKLFGAPRQWKYFRPLFQTFFLSGGVLPPRQSNTTPPSPTTEITNILFYILNFASKINFKM